MASKEVIKSLHDQEKILQEKIEVFKSVQKGDYLHSLRKKVHVVARERFANVKYGSWVRT